MRHEQPNKYAFDIRLEANVCVSNLPGREPPTS